MLKNPQNESVMNHPKTGLTNDQWMTGFTNLYSKWYTYISGMDKNVRDHDAKPNKESFIFNLVSILGTLYLLYFNKLVLGLINFKLGNFSELLKL